MTALRQCLPLYGKGNNHDDDNRRNIWHRRQLPKCMFPLERCPAWGAWFTQSTHVTSAALPEWLCSEAASSNGTNTVSNRRDMYMRRLSVSISLAKVTHLSVKRTGRHDI